MGRVDYREYGGFTDFIYPRFFQITSQGYVDVLKEGHMPLKPLVLKRE